MFRKLSIVGLAGVIVLVGSGLTMALAGNRSITQPETLVFTEKTLKTKFVDVGKEGFSTGDSFLFVDALTDPTDRSRVGTVRGQCTVQIGHWQTCQVGGFINDRGEIFVSGVVQATQQPTPLDFAITGGTGDFDNARGSVHVAPTSNTESETTISVLP